jgi:hypothetical protein
LNRTVVDASSAKITRLLPAQRPAVATAAAAAADDGGSAAVAVSGSFVTGDEARSAFHSVLLRFPTSLLLLRGAQGL